MLISISSLSDEKKSLLAQLLLRVIEKVRQGIAEGNSLPVATKNACKKFMYFFLIFCIHTEQQLKSSQLAPEKGNCHPFYSMNDNHLNEMYCSDQNYERLVKNQQIWLREHCLQLYIHIADPSSFATFPGEHSRPHKAVADGDRQRSTSFSNVHIFTESTRGEVFGINKHASSSGYSLQMPIPLRRVSYAPSHEEAL